MMGMSSTGNTLASSNRRAAADALPEFVVQVSKQRGNARRRAVDEAPLV